MTIDPDPYRVLGLVRGATADEIKRAYRRLAKINHPDAAGPTALPRFLAIQAAYEQLIGRPASNGRRPANPPPPAPRAWEADAERADATRRAYGGRRQSPPSGRRSAPPGRSGTTGGGTPGTPPGSATGAKGGSTGTAGDAGPADGQAAGRSSRSGRAGGGPGQGTTGRTGRRRPPGPDGATGPPPRSTPDDASNGARGTRRNKATLGSTSYDDADGPFEPDWRGASWYGTTSGTYWTLNPKEYADPRKHGPEYQARARRATRSQASDPGAPPPPEPDLDDEAADSSAGEPAPDPAARPTHTTSSWWESTAGAGAASHGEPPPAGSSRWSRARRPTAGAEPPPPDLGRAAADIARAIGDERVGGVRGRIARAIIGWLPIAFGIGWLLGELTGCGRFAATCDGATEPFVLLLQVGVLAVLLLVPLAATLATSAAIALLAAAVVATLILSATGSAADEGSRRATLGVVLLIAWLIGLGIGIARRVRSMSAPGRPVS